MENANETPDHGDIDPQYLYILPKFLTVTFEMDLISTTRPHRILDGPDLVHFLLFGLSRPSKRNRMTHTDISLPPESEGYKQFCSENKLKKSEITFLQYAWYRDCYEALTENGLDIRGGLSRLYAVELNAARNGTGFPTSSMIVTDAEKAAVFVKLGIKLDSSIPQVPEKFAEAAALYGNISALVGDDDTIEQVEERIRETKDEQELWALRREKFRLEIDERYMDILIDIGEEVRLEAKLATLKSKKRQRTE